MDLVTIVQFACRPDCPRCEGTGHVCEDHSDRVWEGFSDNGCPCAAPGMPCSEGRKG